MLFKANLNKRKKKCIEKIDKNPNAKKLNKKNFCDK